MSLACNGIPGSAPPPGRQTDLRGTTTDVCHDPGDVMTSRSDGPPPVCTWTSYFIYPYACAALRRSMDLTDSWGGALSVPALGCRGWGHGWRGYGYGGRGWGGGYHGDYRGRSYGSRGYNGYGRGYSGHGFNGYRGNGFAGGGRSYGGGHAMSGRSYRWRPQVWRGGITAGDSFHGGGGRSFGGGGGHSFGEGGHSFRWRIPWRRWPRWWWSRRWWPWWRAPLINPPRVHK